MKIWVLTRIPELQVQKSLLLSEIRVITLVPMREVVLRGLMMDSEKMRFLVLLVGGLEEAMISEFSTPMERSLSSTELLMKVLLNQVELLEISRQ